MTALELLQSGQPFKALPLLAKKAKKEPTLQNLLALSSAQRGTCNFEKALEILMRCNALAKGKSAEIWNNIAQVYSDQGKFRDVPELFRQAVKVGEETKIPNQPMQQILLGFAYSLMRFGVFENTWQAFEAGRLGVSWGALPGTKVWQGEKNARVLIVQEGGFGDAFLFSRWIPKVREISHRVGLLMFDKLTDFCDWKRFGVNEVLNMRASVKAYEWDYTISMMSLPGIFGMKSFADVPPDLMREAFMETIPTQQRLPRIQHNPPRIGFCWRAEEMGSVRKVRSLDDPTASTVAKALAKYGPVYGLCPQNKGLHKFDKFKVPARIIQEEAKLVGWRDTAEYIRSMDMVVSVDTAAFHLAGLLGVPTLLLLPVRSDWKWAVPGIVSDPWYGNHVRYYRETNPLGWSRASIITAARGLSMDRITRDREHLIASKQLESELHKKANEILEEPS